MKISIVSPIYNAEWSLKELDFRICESIEQITNNYEIILADDFGPENSWSLIEDLCNFNWWFVISERTSCIYYYWTAARYERELNYYIELINFN